MKLQHGNIVENVKRGLILQQVNCQGVMGSGVAAAIRGKWPVVYEKYMELWMEEGPEIGYAYHLGKMQPVEVEEGLYVINLFGQQYYGRTGVKFTSYDALDTSLGRLHDWMFANDFTSEDVHHPLIGSGLGGGKWPIVASIISEHLGPDTTLWMYP